MGQDEGPEAPSNMVSHAAEGAFVQVSIQGNQSLKDEKAKGQVQHDSQAACAARPGPSLDASVLREHLNALALDREAAAPGASQQLPMQYVLAALKGDLQRVQDAAQHQGIDCLFTYTHKGQAYQCTALDAAAAGEQVEVWQWLLSNGAHSLLGHPHLHFGMARNLLKGQGSLGQAAVDACLLTLCAAHDEQAALEAAEQLLQQARETVLASTHTISAVRQAGELGWKRLVRQLLEQAFALQQLSAAPSQLQAQHSLGSMRSRDQGGTLGSSFKVDLMDLIDMEPRALKTAVSLGLGSSGRIPLFSIQCMAYSFKPCEYFGLSATPPDLPQRVKHMAANFADWYHTLLYGDEPQKGGQEQQQQQQERGISAEAYTTNNTSHGSMGSLSVGQLVDVAEALREPPEASQEVAAALIAKPDPAPQDLLLAALLRAQPKDWREASAGFKEVWQLMTERSREWVEAEVAVDAEVREKRFGASQEVFSRLARAQQGVVQVKDLEELLEYVGLTSPHALASCMDFELQLPRTQRVPLWVNSLSAETSDDHRPHTSDCYWTTWQLIKAPLSCLARSKVTRCVPSALVAFGSLGLHQSVMAAAFALAWAVVWPVAAFAWLLLGCLLLCLPSKLLKGAAQLAERLPFRACKRASAGPMQGPWQAGSKRTLASWLMQLWNAACRQVSDLRPTSSELQQTGRFKQAVVKVVPVRGWATLPANVVLQPLLDAVELGYPEKVFAAPAVQAFINHRWRYCTQFFMLFQLLDHLAYMALFIAYAVHSSRRLGRSLGLHGQDDEDGSGSDGDGIVSAQCHPSEEVGLLVVLLVMALGYLIQEFKQASASRGNSLRQVWTWIDVSSLGLMLAIIGHHFNCSAWAGAGWDEGHAWAHRGMCSMEILLLFMRLLYFSFAVPKLGSFVRMVIEVVKDLALFMVLLAVLFVGFSVAFVVIQGSPMEEYSSGGDDRLAADNTVGGVFMLQFELVFGGLSAEYLGENLGPRRISVLWACMKAAYQILVALVMMNILIAVINTSYARVDGSQGTVTLLNKATLIVEAEACIPYPVLKWLLGRVSDAWLFSVEPLPAVGAEEEQQEVDDKARFEQLQAMIADLQKQWAVVAEAAARSGRTRAQSAGQ